jgi:flagellar biosynthesis/type III secretory pathway protein FliH
VVKRKVDLDEGIVADQLESVLGIIARPTELVVSIHPADRTVAERAVPGLAGRSSLVRHVEFVEDAALERGSCVARTRGSVPGDGGAGGGGEIDASITTQVQRVIEALLPGGPAKPGATAPPRVGAEGGA